MQKSTQNWIALAEDDYKTAEALLKSRRYLHVLFFCQQGIEKMIKALIAEKTAGHLPRIHNLINLAKTAELIMDEEQTNLCRDLSNYYIQSRYPEEIRDMARLISVKEASDFYARTGDLLK